MSSNLQILKLFSRKLSNCRFKVPVKSIVEYMERGQFGYSVKAGEDEVITNDSVFASSVGVVIKEIRGIFRNPRLHLRKEELVQNVSVASHFDNETLRKTYKDSSLWKVNGGGISPESVHTFVYEDDYTIYENRFLCALIDELYSALTKKINAIKASLTTLNSKITDKKDVLGLPDFEYLDLADKEGGIPVILATKDARVGVIEALIRNKKKLQVLMHSNIYKSCKKKGDFYLAQTRPTNILMQDKHYHVCYDFYLHYLRRDVDLTTESKMYESFVFVNLLCALDKYGYVCKNVEQDVFVDSRINIKYDDLVLVKDPFEISFKKGKDDDIVLSVINTVSGSVMTHRIKVVHSSNELVQLDNPAKKINADFMAEYDNEMCKTWFISDLAVDDESAMCILPAEANVADKFLQLIKGFTLLAEGALTVYARVCPVCGSSMVTPTDKDYNCVACECVYHLFYHLTRDLIWVKRLPKTSEAQAPFSAYIKRHFFAKISQMEEDKKGYYNELKNYILQYKKVSARASWSCETFSNRRIPKIRMAVRGKTLVAFFALDPKEYENSKYHGKDMGATKKFAETPMMVKVKSERGLKFAKELVDIVLEGLVKNENYEAVDYKLPYKSDKQLWEEGWIKVIGDVELSDFTVEEPALEEVAEEIAEEVAVTEETTPETQEETIVEEVAVAEETTVTEEAVSDAQTQSVEGDSVANDVNALNNEARLKRHFLAKISQLEEEKKAYYNELKNCIMQYKKVSARASWSCETFSNRRIPKVRMAVRGKTLVAFFALDPKEYENTKYYPRDMGDTKKFAETPMMVKVKSERGLKYAKELVEIVMADLVKNAAYTEEDFKLPYKSDKELFEEGLIKISGDASTITLSDEVAQAPVVEEPMLESGEETTLEEVTATEEAVEEIAATEEVVEEVATETVATETTQSAEPFAFATSDDYNARLKCHFLAKISQIDEDKKGYYSELKNYILQYKKVSARASWGCETFNNRRIPRARMAVRGKTLVLFLALDPKEYENSKYYPKDMSGTKKFADTPMMVKVKSERGLKYAKELLDIVMADLIKDEKYVEGDYQIIRKSDKELFAEGLIKINGDPATIELSDEI